MMARLQEAANKPVVGEEEEKKSKPGAGKVEQGEGLKTPDHDVPGGVDKEETDVEAPGRGSAGAGGEWVEETVEHPAPDYGVDSPVIRYVGG